MGECGIGFLCNYTSFTLFIPFILIFYFLFYVPEEENVLEMEKFMLKISCCSYEAVLN